MKYVAYDAPGDAGVLHVAEMRKPNAGAGEVVIAVRAAGVSRADVLQRRGLYPPPAGVSPVLGLEVAGNVAEVGSGVSQWRPGDDVCALCNGGGYAQYVSVPQGQVLPIPDRWSAIEAATLPENAFTVYDNVFTRARLAPGETIVVHGGTSGIGTTAIMFATALGSQTIATAGNDAKCRACVQLGAIAAINYTTTDFVSEVLRLTENCGTDVVLDIVGGDYIPRDLQCLALDGRVACIALQRGRTTELDLGVLLAKRATLLGSHLRARTAAQKADIAQRLRDRIWPLLPARTAIVPVVDAVYPFERAAEAHARLEEGAHIGKIILTFSDISIGAGRSP
ncbi:MAG: NAD(P)H-quinone oxidoreductase [Candidatus Eremiobacteraeota bacterium]|nr:NAD(P)H-quinone oxidoreductase [Candidatus Eremiobacteraeota bacterium]